MSADTEPSSGKGCPFVGMVQVDGRPARMVVVRADGARLEAIVESAALPEKLRCVFVVSGTKLELLTRVVRTVPTGPHTRALLRCDALGCSSGRKPIEVFLTDRLGMSSVPPQNFLYDQRGVFFSFDVQAVERATSGARSRIRPQPAAPLPEVSGVLSAPAAQKPQEGAAGALPVSNPEPREKRYESRIRMALGAKAYSGRTELIVVIAEVSDNGSRLQTPGLPPMRGSEVVLDVRLPVGRLDLPIRACGTVKWTAREESGAATFGLEWTRIEDGARGRHWRRFVEQAAEDGELVPAGRRGRPLQA